MKGIALSTVKDQLSKYLDLAGKNPLLITRHGKPAGLLIGFPSEEDWLDYRLENDPNFLARIEKARQSLKNGKGIPIENID
jgi:PHD/YefM family antitoxin component YafN of YafNO toxin-antitoxin module